MSRTCDEHEPVSEAELEARRGRLRAIVAETDAMLRRLEPPLPARLLALLGPEPD